MGSLEAAEWLCGSILTRQREGFSVDNPLFRGPVNEFRRFSLRASNPHCFTRRFPISQDWGGLTVKDYNVAACMLSAVCSLALLLSGCAPNRAEWMSQAATQQAQAATGSIGDEQEVKKESRVAAQVLRTLSDDASNAAAGPNQQAAIAFAQDAILISSGLDAIADSQTDEQFTQAVWSMCDSESPGGRSVRGKDDARASQHVQTTRLIGSFAGTATGADVGLLRYVRRTAD